MTKKAILALLIAIVLPLFGYLLLSYYSHRDIRMPQRFFYDSVTVKTDHGKTSFDTAWHHVKNLHFTNQLGQQVSLNDLKGKVIVMDFFFTHCPTICPQLAINVKKLQSAFAPSDSLVQFISISVDPENDSVPRLLNWAEKFNINPDNWWLATGNRDSIYNFALTEMKASVADVGVDTGFIHTQNLFLLDRDRVVRGWYDGLDSAAQQRLIRDIPLLMLEKDHKKSFGEFLRELIKKA